MEGRNTYRLFGTLGFKNSEFNKRVDGWGFSLIAQAEKAVEGQKKVIMASFSPTMVIIWGGWSYH